MQTITVHLNGTDILIQQLTSVFWAAWRDNTRYARIAKLPGYKWRVVFNGETEPYLITLAGATADEVLNVAIAVRP